MLSNLKSHINKERESLLIYMRDDLSGLNVMQEKMDQACAQEEGDQYFFNNNNNNNNNIYIYMQGHRLQPTP